MAGFLLFIGVILVAGGVLYLLVFNNSSPSNKTAGKDFISETIASTNINTMLQKWNEQEISMDLIRLQDKPQIFRHYIDSIKQRFVDNQNTKTAQSRISFLEKQVKILNLASQYSDIQNELSLKNKKYENELLRINLENQTLTLDFKDAATEKELQRLENERRRLEKQLELAKLKRELDALNNPPPPPPREPTKAEVRAQSRKEIEERIESVTKQIEKIEKFSVLSDEEKQRQLNQLRNKLFDLQEQQNDFL